MGVCKRSRLRLVDRFGTSAQSTRFLARLASHFFASLVNCLQSKDKHHHPASVDNLGDRFEPQCYNLEMTARRPEQILLTTSQSLR